MIITFKQNVEVKCSVSKQAQFYGSLNGWEK